MARPEFYATVTKTVLHGGRLYREGTQITSHDLADKLVRYGKADPAPGLDHADTAMAVNQAVADVLADAPKTDPDAARAAAPVAETTTPAGKANPKES